jgi:TonB-dependent starch-binding outer membrane protein SusC
MRKKRLLVKAGVLCLLVLLGLPAFSQNSEATGKISDSSGAPLVGASISIAGTARGTTTDANGVYHLAVRPGDKTLLISAVGYTSRQVSIGGSGLIVLSVANSSLNDVVVIGYGTARKKDLTGSIAVVSEKDFQKGAITTPDQMIAGKVAGVSVISNSGSPGAGSTIRIRGGTSINASNDPLFVIDGVPVSNNGISGAANPLSMINSDDIESFTVLKDASATAIYGSRAANGVIIITTKKGRSAGLDMTFNTVNSVATIAKRVSVLNGDQMRSVVKANGTAAQIGLLGNANTDWQDQVFHSAFGTTNDLSITGGIKGLPYRVSVGWQDQDGILRTDNLQKTSVAIALNPVLLDNHLKIDINVKGSIENTRFANQGAIGAAIGFDPTQPVYAKTKSKRFGGYFEWVDANGNLLSNIPYNPLGLLYENINKSKPERSIGNIQLDYNFPFLPELHVKVNAGYDVSLGKGTTFIPDSAASNYNVANPTTKGGSNNRYKQTTTNTVLEYYLNYVKDFKSIKSRLDAIAGYSYNDFQTTNYLYGNYSAARQEINTGDSIAPFDKPQNVIISFIGRVAYSFDNRFYLTGSIREDGSSRFGPYGEGVTLSTIGKGHKWGSFPSGAFKWKLSNEDFLKNSKVISDLDLRIGYGITGQQDGITDYGYLTTYALAAQNAAYYYNGQYIQGQRPSGTVGNLTWEQTATTNLGLDYGFLNNRITGSVDLYDKKTSHLLLNTPQSAGTNFSAYVLENVGNVENKGIEFSVNATPIATRDLNWQLSFNIAYNKSRVTNLTVLPDDPTFPGVPWDQINGTGAQGFAQIQQVGYAKNTFNLYQQIYDKSGHPIEGLFNDVNRDGIINSSDAVKSRHSDPDVFLGFSTNVSYRKWSAGFVVRASFGNYVYDQFLATDGSLSNVLGGSVISNVSTDYLKTHFQGNTTTQFLSDYYLYNASFLKMDNFNIGYDFGKVFNNRSTLRGSIIVQNVFVITKYPGLDPEISSGIDGNTYPRPRTYSLGLNLHF